MNVNGSYGQFDFQFFKGATGPNTGFNTTGVVPVSLQNVKVTAIDVDTEQFLALSSIDSYTLSVDTNLKLSQRAPATGFPANVTFQGAPGPRTDQPQDQVVVTYGRIDTFSVKFGRSGNETSIYNYFGVAFEELGWPNTTPVTVGVNYTVSYAANGAT